MEAGTLADEYVEARKGTYSGKSYGSGNSGGATSGKNAGDSITRKNFKCGEAGHLNDRCPRVQKNITSVKLKTEQTAKNMRYYICGQLDNLHQGAQRSRCCIVEVILDMSYVGGERLQMWLWNRSS